MMKYKVEDFSNQSEFKDAVLRDSSLSDMEKLSLVFSASKESLKRTDAQLYYAILAVLDSNKKIVAPPEYFAFGNKG